MWRTSRSFLRLPWEAKRFALQSLLILPITYVGLPLLGLKRLLNMMERITNVPSSPATPNPQEISTSTQLFSAVARRWPVPLKCLARSVALSWLLRLRGIDAVVHIGVRKSEHNLDAHAWVQVGDFVINDAETVSEQYARVLPTYSNAQSGR